MKTYSMCFGQTLGYRHPHPERTASRSVGNYAAPTTFKIWPNRKAMAKAIRKQQEKYLASMYYWKPLQPLMDAEGWN